ncbi:MAG: hypothetical protein ACI4IX_02155 [Acutalibacteraceae bacterium]
MEIKSAHFLLVLCGGGSKPPPYRESDKIRYFCVLDDVGIVRYKLSIQKFVGTALAAVRENRLNSTEYKKSRSESKPALFDLFFALGGVDVLHSFGHFQSVVGFLLNGIII